MALTPQNNEAFAREVDDELRRDRLMGFWERWGKLTVALAILLVAAFGGWMYWQHRQTQAAGEQGERFAGALEDLGANGKAKAAPVLASLAKDGTPGYRAMAKMTQADVALAGNDLSGAARLFGEIAADADVPQPIRDLAIIRQTTAQFDSLPPAQVIARLKALAVPGHAFFGSAGELSAAAYLRSGQTREAGALYAAIAQDEGVPESLRSRSVQMAGVLGVDAVDQNMVGPSEDAQKQ